MAIYDAALFIYNLTLIPAIFISVLFIILALTNLLVDKKNDVKYPKLKELPFISVQIPTYNDPVAARCVKHCMEFDYPGGRYEIIIADDSTNIETQVELSKFSEDNPEFIKYIHRGNREGFKPGALKNAMKATKGELIVIFDADWIPGKEFLKKIVRPFADPKVAIVQTRQGFYNQNTNLIARFAAYLLSAYHTIIMPINNKINCVFFCGTAGAIRRSMFEEVGGWNLNSITEDSDLSIQLLLRGYKSVYLDFETPSEVPTTYESFIKQQMRWCYGNTRAFIDNASKILIKKGLSIKQRIMIVFITMGNLSAPIVIIMTVFGLGGWFLGEPKLFEAADLTTLAYRLLLTAGFLALGIAALYKNKQLRELHYMFLSLFTLGLVLAMANSIAFLKAVANKRLHWYCTAKDANSSFVENDIS